MSVNSSSKYHCMDSKVAMVVSITFGITKIILLYPFCIFFVFALEMIHGIVGITYVSGIITDDDEVTKAAVCFGYIIFFGQIGFHTPSPVRYLAVVHPSDRPGGGSRERVDQSKQRAFHSITAILGVTWLWFAGMIVSLSLGKSKLLNTEVGCALELSSNWFSLPSSLVLPPLFLHRARKLFCVK
ncbi:hypothetical protein KUCAC02_031838 [Chaenocephalus aceratus]|nr:hypothetical protein KUCAC02_031838 [Chaenocephalus aceratus]